MAHSLDSAMIYIHPPLAIIGYVLILLSTVFIGRELFLKKQFKATKKILYTSWIINLLGVVTGAIWAQWAWGSYWSWDPKETVSLIMFVVVVIGLLFYENPSFNIKCDGSCPVQNHRKHISFGLHIAAIITIFINIWIPLGNFGLHSYG